MGDERVPRNSLFLKLMEDDDLDKGMMKHTRFLLSGGLLLDYRGHLVNASIEEER